MRVATVTLHEMQTNCDEAFNKPRNRTLERFKFVSRKQKEKETLRQFWHTLTGLAAKCEFADQTKSLVMDTFIQNKNNKIKPCKNDSAQNQRTIHKKFFCSQWLTKEGYTNIRHTKDEIFAVNEFKKSVHKMCFEV